MFSIVRGCQTGQWRPRVNTVDLPRKPLADVGIAFRREVDAKNYLSE